MIFKWNEMGNKYLKYFMIKDPRSKLKETIQKELEINHTVVLIYLDIVKLSDIEGKYGFSISNEIIKTLEDNIVSAAQSIFKLPARLIGYHRLWGDDFSVFVAWHNREEKNEQEFYHQKSILFKQQLETELNKEIILPGGEMIQLHIGFVKLESKEFNKEIYKAVKTASQMAKFDILTNEFLYHRQFFEILDKEDLQSYYQPIISLKDGVTFGWEGLIRGPEKSHFFLPHQLFEYAEKTGRSLLLESISRKKAMGRLQEWPSDAKLFINIDPRSMEDTTFLRKEALQLLENHGLSPSNIVLEITERHAITNFDRFREIIHVYRKLGYLIAVDDAGAGYSSMETIVQTYPNYIKLDMSLTRGIDFDPVRRAIVEAFVMVARKVGCKIIAEGIETENELKTLIDLGVDFGQGFLLGRPANGLCHLSGQVLSFFENHLKQDSKFHRAETGVNRVKNLTAFSPSFPPETKVKKIHQIFEENPRLDHLVIVSEDKPVGLVMKQRLYQVLGGQYGIPLYFEKNIETLMDTSPLIVDKFSTIEEVSKAAMSREPDHIYDVVIVTHEGKHIGSITVQKLLDTIAQAKLEWAAYTNPLTQLPGNILIDRELERRLLNEESFHIVYCDLDHFKHFNDTYGFDKGDQVIKRTSELIRSMVSAYGSESDFVGHIGGDDFIFITAQKDLTHMIRYITDNFIHSFQDIVPIQEYFGDACLSMSMAGIHCLPKKFKQVSQIAELSAKVKKLSKSKIGCSYASEQELLAIAK